MSTTRNAKSLERKTKKELIDIILNQDIAEVNQRDAINQLQSQCGKLSNAYEKAKHDKNVAQNEFEEACDRLADATIENRKLKKHIMRLHTIYTIIIVAVVLCFALL